MVMFTNELQRYRSLKAEMEVLEEVIEPVLRDIGYALGFSPQTINSFTVDQFGNVAVCSEYFCRGYPDTEVFDIPYLVISDADPVAAAKIHRDWLKSVELAQQQEADRQREIDSIARLERQLANLKAKHYVGTEIQVPGDH
jgi:hypothetical protein